MLERAYPIAHRGLSVHHAENTLEAIAAAIGHAPVVEVDVRATSDCVLVCTHDRTLERCYGIDRHVGQLTWAALHEAVPGIPRLADVLDAFGAEVGWIIDCKVTRPRAIEALERVVAEAGVSWESASELRRGTPLESGTAAFESSDPHLLQSMHSKLGAGVLELVKGSASAAQLAITAPFITTYAQGVTLPDRLASARMLGLLGALRLGTYVYTINDRARFDELVVDGASGIFTDDVTRIH